MDLKRKGFSGPKTDSPDHPDIVPPTPPRKYRNKSFDRLRFLRGSSSGISSDESYGIDRGIKVPLDLSPIPNEKTASKRLWQSNTTHKIHEGKRFKMDKKTSTQNQKCNETASALQDTLDNLDISIIFKNGSSHLNKATGSKIDSMPKQPHPKPICEDDDLFSQSFNTQQINQIDLAMIQDEDKESKSSFENEKENFNSKHEVPKDEFFKMPILKSFRERAATIKAKKDKTIDRSLLFNDETVTSIYKKEVDQLFEQIEHSICAMGTVDYENTISDKVLDVFFAEDHKSSEIDFNENKLQEELQRSLTDRSATSDDSLLSNLSLGAALKEALRNNASKNIEAAKGNINNADLTLNMSVPDSEFRKFGQFYDLPDKAKDLIKQYKGIEKLYDWQEECLNLAINNRKNLIYALPTSGGKTLVAEILMLREILCYQRNAILILPYVAIVQEKVWDFSPFGVALDFLVEEYASSKGVFPPRKRRRKRSVYIATIEKALGLVNSLIESGRLNEIGLIVIDELHLIGEEGRGSTLEACLAKILIAKGNIQIIGMSATIGNIMDLSKFLNAEVYTKNFRPVELTEYVKCENMIAKINWNYADENDILIEANKVDYMYSEAIKKLDPDMLGGLVLEVIPKGSCLVFCASKNNCENVVHLLCKLTQPHLKEYKKDDKIQLLEALKGEAGELCRTLKVSVPFGIAYHHSGLTSEERRLLEDAFRAGTISVICCTSTLAAGVNLPAKRVLLRSPYIGREFINLSRYKQMAGRAGRAGFEETGESIIVTSKADLPKVKELLMSPMNKAMSSMHLFEGRGLRHLLLSCISLGIANTRVQLHKVAQSTLMAVQVDKLDINIKQLTDGIIKKLFKMGALEEGTDKGNRKSLESQCNVTVKLDSTFAPDLDASLNSLASTSAKPKRRLMLTNNTKLVVSSLGTAAIKGGLDLSRAHQLYDDLYQAQKSLVLLNCLHLLYLVTPYETSEHIKPNIQVYYDVLTHLNEKEAQTSRILGFDEAATCKMATGKATKQIPESIQNRFYVTLMLYDLWNEMPVFKVSEKYQINRGIVQNLMTNSSTFSSNVVHFCEELEEFWAFGHLLKGMSQRLSHCCVRELVPLMELPSVKQSRAKQLYAAGYKKLQSIAKASVSELVENIEHMTRRTAGQLIAAAKMLLLEKVENLREEAEDVLDGVEFPRQLSNVTNISSK
ncbi:unnamed protein product [Ceutorhynchus assimilis]|uniref:Helicase POLQ-like n=1 Tax=Ceutorhynchus assimilis TaxID=467358 RepID=A0A9N9QN24_9CUCU|nr:unnamed protein product [Ceutorhynchus assimilis]